MSFARLLTQPVTILSPVATEDRYGDLQDIWTSATETEALGWLTQLNESEVLGTRDAQVSDWKLFLFPSAVISSNDRVVANGITYEVDGPPLQAHTPRGPHHQEVSLHAVSG